jgi:hypothetical protein
VTLVLDGIGLSRTHQARMESLLGIVAAELELVSGAQSVLEGAYVSRHRPPDGSHQNRREVEE